MPTPRKRFALSALAFASAHLIFVEYYTPIRRIFSSRPIQGVDFDLHIGQVYRVVEGLRGWGKSWVYDISLLAGQPEGAITDAGSKAWELWTYVLHSCGVSLPVAFNSWVLLTMVACPALVYMGSRAFDFNPTVSLVASAMSSSLWFFDSFVHWLWFVGMVSWALACCLSVLTLGLFYRFVRTGDLRPAVTCALSLGIGHLIHPYTFFVLVAPMAALYLRAYRQLSMRTHIAVAGICLVAVGINGYWLWVAFRHWHYILDSAFFAQGQLSYLAYDFLGVLRAGENTGVIGVRTGFRFLYLGLAIAGLVMMHRGRDPRTQPFAIGVVGLLLFAYVGAELRVLAQIQPYRVLSAAILFSTIPAALFVSDFVSAATSRQWTASSRMLFCVLAVVLVQHLAQQVLYFTPRLIPETDRFSDGSLSPLTKYGYLAPLGRYSHVTYSLPHDVNVEPGYEPCIRWLEKHVERGSRILVEGSVLGERLAWRTSFEVIGGFFERNVAHAYASYFRRYPQRASQDDLARYLRAYAIDYVVAYSPRPEFDQSADLARIHANGLFRIYRTLFQSNRILEGSGSLKASTNRIDVSGSASEQPLVLSYHFHPALRCAPSCRVERAADLLGPVGAIRIPAPHPKSFRIYNSYDW